MTRFTLGTFSKQYINHEFLHRLVAAIGAPSGILKRNKKLETGKKTGQMYFKLFTYKTKQKVERNKTRIKVQIIGFP